MLIPCVSHPFHPSLILEVFFLLLAIYFLKKRVEETCGVRNIWTLKQPADLLALKWLPVGRDDWGKVLEGSSFNRLAPLPRPMGTGYICFSRWPFSVGLTLLMLVFLGMLIQHSGFLLSPHPLLPPTSLPLALRRQPVSHPSPPSSTFWRLCTWLITWHRN